MIGKEILNYKIIKLLGAGGMGTVYMAVHKHISNQKVAIKVIHPEIANDYTRERLRQEATYLAGLDHPNIVKLINYHIDDDGTIYLIMEYADGASMEKFITEVNGLVVEDRVCGLFEPILDAFGYAHKKGILHRDIKPSNIIITPEGTPKILDFGIAKIIGDESETDKVIVGTPSYMSPEQVRGESLDNRSDIYSLGVLLHQMMTGNAPYDTTTLTEHQINDKVVNEPLPRLRSFYKYVSDKTQKVVDKATAKDKEDRYRDCDSFKKDLHKAIYPPKMPRWIIGAAAGLILVCCGLGLWYWDYNRIKVNYYRDYTEQWGEPVGIGKLSSDQYRHSQRAYRIESSRGKVRRLTLVNSSGKAIDDGESERVDRPTDALYYYTPEGHVSRVKVMDRNGKVQYVKVYNDNMKTAVFQYDDEHGTEKVLGAQTVGYVDAFGNGLNDNKGKISRYHLTYDDNGYVTRVDYAGLYNTKVHDADNIYGRSYKRDDKGRVIEESYLNAEGDPQSTKWGLGIKTFEYDDQDNWVRSEYLTIDRAPSLDASDGCAVYEMTYDSNGNLIEATHHYSDGTLMLPKRSGIAGVRNTYDEHGNPIKQEILGVDGNLSYNEGGGAINIYEYDENGFWTDLKSFDTEGNPVIGKYNYWRAKAINDERGNQLSISFYDINDEPTLYMGSHAQIKNTYDSLGNQTSTFVYSVDGELINSDDMGGVAGLTIEYDQFSNPVKVVYYGADSLPARHLDGSTVIRREYDVRGNVTRISMFEDVDCTIPQEDLKGVAVRTFVYDDNGYQTQANNFDGKGNLTFDDEHWAVRKSQYDDAGNMTSVRYYAPDGSPVYTTGRMAGIDRKYDNHGNITEEIRVGTDGKPAPNYYIMRYKYDGNDNQIEEAVFNVNGTPAIGSRKYHRGEMDYDGNNRGTEARYFDTAGNLTGLDGTNVAIMRYEYDKRGNLEKLSYFGKDRKPTVGSENYASYVSEYDHVGRIVRQRYFDVDGKPTDPKVMVPEGVTGYDKFGNMDFIASCDGNGNYIYNPALGASIMRLKYDAKGNQIEQSYYDQEDKPMISKNKGFHKETLKYDNRGNLTETAFFDEKDQPLTNTVQGYHRATSTYDDLNRTLTETRYDVKGNEVCTGGNNFSHVEYIYSDNSSTASRARLYAPGRRLVASMRYVNGSWVPDSATGVPAQTDTPAQGGVSADWRQGVRELQSQLPMNLGEEAGNLEFTSINLIGNNTLEFVFTAEESKYEMNKTLQSNYQQFITTFAQTMKSNFPSSVKIVVKLLDKPGREMMKTTV